MKALLSFFVVATVFASSANAVYRPGWERPLMRAKLAKVEGLATYPRAESLTINKQDGAKEPTSFTLVEDTGIRCIKAPCPSEKATQFRIQKVSSSFHDASVVRYEAVEILKNIPRNVRIAPRHLNVTESHMELVAPGGGGFMHRTMWEVEVQTFGQASAIYQGNPQHLMTIASEMN